ncbi:MAG TPA: hypothetical protein VKT82_28360 [Ktedonobacterales bacterium]|nr:hypothetical protein [Ktedonobacterales bacterium]
MNSSRWLRLARILAALGMLLALASCAAGGTGSNTGSQGNTSSTETPTPAAPSPTPTLAPPVCNGPFNPNYVSTLPDATFKATTVFAQVQLPPLTRSYDNDAAGGTRGRNMCSAGTTQSVTDFMTQHLTALGWQKTGSSTQGCLSAGPSYAQQQCWQNGNYALNMGINSNLNWIILFIDPDFTAGTTPSCNSNFKPGYVSTLPDADSTKTHVFAQVQLPPETRSYDNDASGGFRGREMCSGGTTQSVTDFMTQHLAQLGWQKQSNVNTCTTVIENYATAQCWKNGSYLLFLGINTNLDWIITFRDPAFM